MSITERCLRCGGPLRRPGYGRRFGSMPREMVVKRVKDAKRKARPDRRTEIEGHPGNLVLPVSKVMRDDPTRTRVIETLERSQEFFAIRKPGLPPIQVHRHVDRNEESQIDRNPDNRDDKGQKN